MTAPRELPKTFEEGATLDLKGTGLSTSGGNVFRAVDNLLLENGYNLRGRRGVQLVGQPGGFVGVARYTFLDRDTGASGEEIVAINDHLWRLKTGSCQIVQVSSTGVLAWDYEVLPNTSGTVELKIYEYPAGVKTLVYTEDLGTGLEAPHLVKTLAHLQEDLETTTAGLGIGEGGNGYRFVGNGVLGEYAFIDNTTWTVMASVGKYAIEVDSSASDTTPMNWANFLPVWDYRHDRLIGLIAEGGASVSMGVSAQPPGTKESGWVSGILGGAEQTLASGSFTTKDGRAYTSENLVPTFTVGQVIGHGGVPAATIPFKRARAAGVTTGDITFPVSYWDKAMGFGGERDLRFGQLTNWTSNQVYAASYRRDLRGPFFAAFKGRFGKAFIPPTFVNHDDVLYIYFTSQGVLDVELHEDFPYKYDGMACYRAGLPRAFIGTLAATKAAGSGGITGDVLAAAEFEYEDHRGNITKGNLPLFTTTSLSNQRLAVSYSSLYVEDPDEIAALNDGTGATTFVVDRVEGKVAVGQYVGFQTYLVRVTAVSETGFTVEDITGSGYTWLIGERIWVAPAAGFRVSPVAFQASVSLLNFARTNNAPMVRTGDAVFGINPGYSVAGGTNARYPDIRRMRIENTGTVSWNAVVSASEAPITLTPNYPTIDSSQRNSAICFAGAKVRVYRSFQNGSLLYEAFASPAGFIWGNTQAFVATSLFSATSYGLSEDASLIGPQLIEPEIGRERDLPPKAAVACTHQGVVVAGGIKGEPNSVRFSEIVEGPEAFPLATNQFDVPATSGGEITAVASDRDDRLAVFKEKAYFDIAGSLPDNTFSVKSVNDGDYGVSSQASLIKIDSTLIGVGPLGFVGVENGVLTPVGEEISAEIINNRFINLRLARAVNNFKERQYQCYIPGVNCDCPVLSRNAENDLCFILDYSNKRTIAWRSYKYGAGAEAFGGWAMYGGIPHHLYAPFNITPSSTNDLGAVFREIPERFVENGVGANLPSTREPQDFFVDHVAAIPYRLRSQFIHLGEPNLPKTFLRMVLHSLYRSIEASKFVPWEATVTFRRNFQESVSYASYTVTFNTVADFQRVIAIKNEQANSLQFEIVVEELFKAPHITGYTMVVSAPYLKEDVKR